MTMEVQYLEILHALHLVVAAARGATLEQRRAQPHRRHPVPALPQIPEPTRHIIEHDQKCLCIEPGGRKKLKSFCVL
jgi:hypothetical protein